MHSSASIWSTKFEEIKLTDEEVCDDDVDERKEDLCRKTFSEKQEPKRMSKFVQNVFDDITQLAGQPGAARAFFVRMVDQRKVYSKGQDRSGTSGIAILSFMQQRPGL